MLDFAQPGFLYAALAAAAIPLILHLIARRPPERAPLPTARFLEPGARATLRLNRRPSDLFLLLLRVTLLLLAGASFSAPRWVPHRQGTVELVILDRGLAGVGWGKAVDLARNRRAGLVLFDTVYELIPPDQVTRARLDSLASSHRGRGASDYRAALASIRPAGRALAEADSLRVTLVSDFSWRGWGEGTGALRELAWPGRLQLVRVSGGEERASSSPLAGEPGTFRVLGGKGYAAAALEASGWTAADRDPAGVYLIADTAGIDAAALLERVRSGATVVAGGGGVSPLLRGVLPWTFDEAVVAGGPIFLPGGSTLSGAAGSSRGRARPGARVLARWSDGRPAAAASRVGAGCAVFLAASPEGGELPLDPGYPELLARLAAGCQPGTGGPAPGMDKQPLDAGALQVLRGEGGRTVQLRSWLGPAEGVPLWRWFLLAALATAVLETVVATRRRES
ncbi:MAG: BatA domain-containing protein [Longimicrobiaceae bacterium]